MMDRGKIEKNDAIAKEFLAVAMADLTVSKILYEQENFSHAVYFLQQSLEKAVKAKLLWIGFLDGYEGVLKIKHQTLREILVILEHKESARSRELVLGEDSEEKIRLFKENFKENLENKKIKDAWSLEAKKINYYLDLVNELQDEEGKVVSLAKDKFDEGYFVGDKSKVTKEEYVKLQVLFTILSTRMTVLGMILDPHNFRSRYPYADSHPLEYKQGLGVIDAFERLFQELEGTLYALGKMTS